MVVVIVDCAAGVAVTAGRMVGGVKTESISPVVKTVGKVM